MARPGTSPPGRAETLPSENTTVNPILSLAPAAGNVRYRILFRKLADADPDFEERTQAAARAANRVSGDPLEQLARAKRGRPRPLTLAEVVREEVRNLLLAELPPVVDYLIERRRGK